MYVMKNEIKTKKELRTRNLKRIHVLFQFFIKTTKKILEFVIGTSQSLQLNLQDSTTRRGKILRLIQIYIKFFESFERRYDSCGPKECCDYYKQVYLLCTSVAFGLPYSPLPFTRSDKDGFPSFIHEFKPLLQGSTWSKRVALTGLRLYPLIKLPVNRDLSNITTPSVNTEDRRNAISAFSDFISANVHHKLDYHAPMQNHNFSVGAGPNGDAVLTSHLDVVGLHREGRAEQTYQYLLTFKSPYIEIFKNLLDGINTNDPNYHNYRSTKISFIPENGGKTRVIAILDYWSQLLLRPVHYALMAFIRTFPNDGAFNQNLLFKKILGHQTKYTASFDLKAATDRFPIEPQITLIRAYFGDEVGNMWKYLMVDRDYFVPGDDINIRWAVGQPLGAYSSWVTFSLTHHWLVQYCAALCDKKYKKPFTFQAYYVLGDDIVIMDEGVAKMYQSVMDSFDVHINTSKSYIADGKHCGEFTKRLFLHHEEISPIPITQIVSVQESIYNLPNLIDTLSQRWGIVSILAEQWASSPHIFSRKHFLLRVIFAFRAMVNGSNAYPFCQYDRHSTLFKLRDFIMDHAYEKRKTELAKSRLTQSLSGVSVSASILKEYKLTIQEGSHVIFDTFKNWRQQSHQDLANLYDYFIPMDAIPTLDREENMRLFVDANVPASLFLTTFQSDAEMTTAIVKSIRSLENCSLDLYFLKLKRRRVEETTQLALKFFYDVLQKEKDKKVEVKVAPTPVVTKLVKEEGDDWDNPFVS